MGLCRVSDFAAVDRGAEKVKTRAITQDDINAAARGNKMLTASVDELRAFVADFKDSENFAGQVTAAAARQMLAAKGRTGMIPRDSALTANKNIRTGTAGTVRITRNSEWQEYIVKPVNGAGSGSWYHTSDLADARATAQTMADDPRYFPMKKNPSKRRAAAPDVARATRTLKAFSGAREVKQQTLDTPRPFSVGLRIGSLLALAYDVGNGDRRIHRFRKSSAPVLIASADGKNLAIVGGKFRFTDRGIVDV